MNAPIVFCERDMLLTDTQIIAREFGMKHAYVMDTVAGLLDDYPDLKGKSSHPKPTVKGGMTRPLNPEYIRLETRHYRGADFEAAVMNEQCFALLVMRFKTPKARIKQREFVNQFYSMRDALLRASIQSDNPAWQTVRDQGKRLRLEETDTIKSFVEYATAQGSQSAQFYYKHVTTATYRCLELIVSKKPKLRDTLDILELNSLVMAEVVAKRALEAGMASGEHYKVIFEQVKSTLERYSESLNPKVMIRNE